MDCFLGFLKRFLVYNREIKIAARTAKIRSRPERPLITVRKSNQKRRIRDMPPSRTNNNIRSLRIRNARFLTFCFFSNLSTALIEIVSPTNREALGVFKVLEEQKLVSFLLYGKKLKVFSIRRKLCFRLY